MKKELQTIGIILLALALCFAGCRKDIAGHACSFDKCPYKGYASFPDVINTGETTVNQEEEPGSDVWALDSLHFQFPNASYDELEERLFTTKK
jgi:hypothetical protein